jgi:hypothetical protein
MYNMKITTILTLLVLASSVEFNSILKSFYMDVEGSNWSLKKTTVTYNKLGHCDYDGFFLKCKVATVVEDSRYRKSPTSLTVFVKSL